MCSGKLQAAGCEPDEAQAHADGDAQPLEQPPAAARATREAREEGGGSLITKNERERQHQHQPLHAASH